MYQSAVQPKFAEPVVLRYWGVKARGSFPALLARVGKVDFVWCVRVRAGERASGKLI